MNKEFSIKEEIRIELKENLPDLGVEIDQEKIYDDVVADELMLDMLTLSIYTSIAEQLMETNIENEEVENKIVQLKSDILNALIFKGIL